MPINNIYIKLYIIAFVILVGTSIAKESPKPNICSNNPIYCQILKNNPKIDKGYAMKLSNIIHHSSKLYNINPHKYAAILAQESMYKLNSINNKSKDYGIAQINQNTIKAYRFDIDKLTNDVEYSVKAGAKVLSDIKRTYGHKEKTYWTRYNSSQPEKRKVYQALVTKYMWHKQ